MKTKASKAQSTPVQSAAPQSTETPSPIGWDKVSAGMEIMTDGPTVSAEEQKRQAILKDVETLKWARSITCHKPKDYIALGRDEDERKARKKEWNAARQAESRICGQSVSITGTEFKLSVKLNGKHSINSKSALTASSAPDILAIEETKERRKSARAILDTGTGADGVTTDGLTSQQIDDLAYCAKQDGLVREPLETDLFHPRAAILSFNEDKQKLVADKKAALRWLQWRDKEISLAQERARDIVLSGFEHNATVK